MAIFLERRMLLALKLESTEGTAVAPAGSDANLLVEGVKFEADVAQFPRDPVSGNLLAVSSVPGARKAKVTFKVPILTSGVAGTAPKIGTLLKLARFGETVVALTSATYLPVAVGVPSASLALYWLPESGNNLQAKMRGCRVSGLKCSPKIGEPLVLEVTIEGVYDGIVDAAGITASGIETTKPQPVLNASFSIHSFSPRISTFGLDCGITGDMREDMNTPDGYLSYLNYDMQPTLSFDPEKELVATFDFMGKVLSGTEGAFSVQVGSTAGSILTITGPKLQLTKCVDGTRGKKSIFNVDGRFNDSSGNDRLSLAFT